MPLLDEGRLLGVLNIEHPEPRGLNQDHRVLLQTLGVPAIIAFHTVDLYKRLERRIRHLSALNLIAARIQEKPYGLNAILHLFLTGITAGSGLGFSRAMLFFVHDGRLRGEVAIGAVTEQQAQEVWDGFEGAEALSTAGLDRLLQDAEESSSESTEGQEREESPFTRAIRQLSVAIEGAAERLRNAWLGETVLVKYNQDDPLRAMLAEVTEPTDVKHAFAAVPLVGKLSGLIGVLIVDNRFLLQERTIDAEDIAGLEAFAGLLALSIDNVRLQQRLTEKQRVEKWREATGGIAHSVGTRVASIDGAVTRLKSNLETASPSPQMTEAGRLLNRLSASITKVQELLLGFRYFVTPKPLYLQHLDLRTVIKDVFQDEEVFPVAISLPAMQIPVLADSLQLGNALMEIVKNSHEAALGVDKRPVVNMDVTTESTTDMAATFARLDITDNGPGIRREIRAIVFNPFFTTKNGTGLGLAIAKEAIEKHRGTIELGNGTAIGARFVVRTPITRILPI